MTIFSSDSLLWSCQVSDMYLILHNRKLEPYTEPTKAKSRESAYSQVLNQSKIDRQVVKIPRVRQEGR